MQKLKVDKRVIQVFQMLLVIAMMTGCGHRKVQQENQEVQAEAPELKIQRLTNELSKAQNRIEELDARVAALTDKLDSTKVTVDNMVGNKPVKIEAVGSMKESASIDGSANSENTAPVIAKSELNGNSKVFKKMDSAIGEFNKSMQLFKTGKFADAELAFNRFTEVYPDHVLAGSAQFYAGESYYMMGEYKLALNEYNKVVSTFGNSPRVASALVRIAHCQEATGNSSESTRTLALARDLFEGNPSLDWSGPGRKVDSIASDNGLAKKAQDLTSSPMEPHESDLKKIADAKIDDLDADDGKHTSKH